MYSLESGDPNVKRGKVEVKQAIKRKCSQVTDVRIGNTAVNSRIEKFAVV